jgi:hypothetical protein
MEDILTYINKSYYDLGEYFFILSEHADSTAEEKHKIHSLLTYNSTEHSSREGKKRPYKHTESQESSQHRKRIKN